MSTKGISIRKATKSDKYRIKTMILQMDDYHYKECPSFAKHVDKDYKKYRERSATLVDRIDITQFYIMELYSTPIGCVMVWDNNGETTLINFFISEACRGRGYGILLMDYVIEHMSTPYCVLSVFYENKKALSFYYTYGFKYIQTQKTDEGELLWLRYDK